MDVVEDNHSPNPVAELQERELETEVAQAIEQLPESERLLLSLYYQEDLTMKEIAAVLEISESRVCQLHARAVLKLRTSLTTPAESRGSVET